MPSHSVKVRVLALVSTLVLATTSSSARGSNGCDAVEELLAAAPPEAPSSEAQPLLERALQLSVDCPERHGVIAFRLAELLKIKGDPQAQSRYEEAIRAEPENAAYELHYADYLRIFRGPQQPLFPEAEQHYHQALRNLREAPDRQPAAVEHLRARVVRSLAALHERDGLTVATWSMLPGLADADENRPIAFFSSQNRVGRMLDVFDQPDTVRDLTSSSLISEERLGVPLDDRQARSLVQPHFQAESLNRLRLRYRDLPVLDVSYVTGGADDAQLTRFDRPGTFNDVRVGAFGLGLERTFDLYPLFDLALRGEWRRGEQEGLVEFQPDAEERFDAAVIDLAATRFVGSNKVVVEGRYVRQEIDQRVANPIDRSLEIGAATLRIQRFTRETYGRVFDVRASEVFTGFALAEETYGDVDVRRRDLFVGFALRGLDWLDFGGQPGRFDIVVQPTLFSARRDGTDDQGRTVSALANRQYRTAITPLYRLEDHENDVLLEEMPRLGPMRLVFLHLTLPLAHDVAVRGPSTFDNVSAGLELATKLTAATLIERDGFLGATVLARLGYTYQRFYHLDQGEHLFLAQVNLGF
jgi:tetratricopeptide (TPR) repeat protein